jgi:hypothetical protein
LEANASCKHFLKPLSLLTQPWCHDTWK